MISLITNISSINKSVFILRIKTYFASQNSFVLHTKVLFVPNKTFCVAKVHAREHGVSFQLTECEARDESSKSFHCVSRL